MNQQAANTAGPGGGGKKRLKNQKWFRVVATTLLFSGTLLVVAVVLYTAFGGRNNNESKYVDTTKTQAVFLNGGQVYFGQIQALNGKYLRMTDVFYLRVNQQVQPNGQQQNSNPELVKLGCELHRPKDEMVINREQVTFWENLKEDSAETTVPGAIKKYKADNPNGQKCNTTTTQSSETPKKQ